MECLKSNLSFILCSLTVIPTGYENLLLLRFGAKTAGDMAINSYSRMCDYVLSTLIRR